MARIWVYDINTLSIRVGAKNTYYVVDSNALPLSHATKLYNDRETATRDIIRELVSNTIVLKYDQQGTRMLVPVGCYDPRTGFAVYGISGKLTVMCAPTNIRVPEDGTLGEVVEGGFMRFCGFDVRAPITPALVLERALDIGYAVYEKAT